MDRWVNEKLKTGLYAYDRAAKETVKISNGTCTLEHFKGTEAYTASHTRNAGTDQQEFGCIYEPSEAIALRVVGITRTKDPVLAFTYRGVNPADLTPITDAGKIMPSILDGSGLKRSRFIGRV